LDLPSTASVHPIFHVSQVKRSPGGNPVNTTLPSDLVMFQVLEKILQRRWISGDHPVEEVFVKWSHMLTSLLTWEAADHLKEQFPRAPTWEHAAAKGGGSVSTIANTGPGHPQHQHGPAEPSSPGERRLGADEAQVRSSSPGVHRPRKSSTRVFGPTWSNS
jgi:hypothetical protein